MSNDHPSVTPPWQVREITDAQELRALAHPVRFALIDLLAEGPLTATQCAERLGQTPANCSYHLRQLEKYGHVRRAEGGHGRERPWESRDEGITWDESAHPAAAAALGSVVDSFRFQSWRSYQATRGSQPPAWQEATLSTDVVAWMTPAELTALSQTIYDAFAPFQERAAQPQARPAGARAVRFFAYGYPGGAADSGGPTNDERGDP